MRLMAWRSWRGQYKRGVSNIVLPARRLPAVQRKAQGGVRRQAVRKGLGQGAAEAPRIWRKSGWALGARGADKLLRWQTSSNTRRSQAGLRAVPNKPANESIGGQ